jgi:hypothetical protein
MRLKYSYKERGLIMAIEIKDSFAEAVTNDKYNQSFLSASAAKAQTVVVLQ